MEVWLSLRMKLNRHQVCPLIPVLTSIQRVNQLLSIIITKIIILHLKSLIHLSTSFLLKWQAKYSLSHKISIWIILMIATEILIIDSYFLRLVIWMEIMLNNIFSHQETHLNRLLLIKVLKAIQNIKI